MQPGGSDISAWARGNRGMLVLFQLWRGCAVAAVLQLSVTLHMLDEGRAAMLGDADREAVEEGRGPLLDPCARHGGAHLRDRRVLFARGQREVGLRARGGQVEAVRTGCEREAVVGAPGRERPLRQADDHARPAMLRRSRDLDGAGADTLERCLARVATDGHQGSRG